jgi:hypothetical protein
MPRCSMYGIFTYIWAIFGVNVGKYAIHGASGMFIFITCNWNCPSQDPIFVIHGNQITRTKHGDWMSTWGDTYPLVMSK